MGDWVLTLTFHDLTYNTFIIVNASARPPVTTGCRVLDARSSLDQVTAKLPSISGAFGKLPDVSAVLFANLSDFGWIVVGAGGIGVFFCGFAVFSGFW